MGMCHFGFGVWQIQYENIYIYILQSSYGMLSVKSRHHRDILNLKVSFSDLLPGTLFGQGSGKK